MRVLRLSVVLAVALSSAFAQAEVQCHQVFEQGRTQLPYPLQELNSASSRLALLAKEGRLLDQNDSRLGDLLQVNRAEAGLCTTSEAVNALLALANPYLRTTRTLDKLDLAQRFVRYAEKVEGAGDPRRGFNLELIDEPIRQLGAELGLDLEVTAKFLGENGPIGIEDIYQAKADEIILVSIWTPQGNHAIALSHVDPIGRTALLIDSNNPDFPQSALVLPVRLEGWQTERLQWKIRGLEANPLNGSILKIVRISAKGRLRPTEDDYRSAKSRVLSPSKEPQAPSTAPPELRPNIPTKLTVTPDADALVTSLNARLKAFASENKDPRVDVDFSSEADLIYFMKPEAAGSLTKGLLNLFQTQNSNGSYAPAARLRNENLLVGYDLGDDSRALELRPKSTYLNIRNEKDYGWFSDNVVDHYGGVGVVLKDEVKTRSIWSLGDSFNNLSQTRDSSDAASLSMFGGFDSTSLPKSGGAYLEALTFGKIGLNDISHLLVLREDMVRGLTHLHLPIYEMEIDRKKGRFVFRKGRLLYSP